MIFVGYELSTKGYKFWDPEIQSVVVSHDVTFDETSFPRCTQNSNPPVQPKQPNQAQRPDDFFPEGAIPEAVRPYVPALQHDEQQLAADPRRARVDDDELSDDDDLYTNRPYSPQPKSELEPDFDWDEWY